MLNPKISKPPKNGTVIIAKFKDKSNKCTAIWNAAHEQWIAAVLQAETCDEGVDYYFETERYDDEELVSWDELN